MNTARVGKVGEDVAVLHLQRLGYRVLSRNVRTPEGEIDIIARDGKTVVFIEVKARRSQRFGSGISAVDAKKRRRIRESAANYMQFYPQGENTMIRFDVITIEHGNVSHVREAF